MYKVLEKILVDNTNDYTYKSGNCIVKKNLIQDIKAKKESKTYKISAKINSEFGNNSYDTKLVIELTNKKLISSYCECSDYQQHIERGNSAYLCKHLIASVITVKDIIIKKHEQKEIKRRENKENLGEYLLKDIEKRSIPKEKVNLEVILEVNDNKNAEELDLYFKIGDQKMYILKDFNDFLYCLNSNQNIVYGKDFTFCPESSYFSEKDQEIIESLEEYLCLSSNIKGKNIRVPSVSLKRILKVIEGKEVKLKLDNSEYNCNIKSEKLPMCMELTESKEVMLLSLIGDIPQKIINSNDVFLSKSEIYLLPREQCDSLNLLNKFLQKSTIIPFKKKDTGKLFNIVLPEIKKAINSLIIEEKIQDKIIRTEPKFKLFFDKDKNRITCDVKILYGEEELGFFYNELSSMHIIRDSDKENLIIRELQNYHFFKSKDSFMFDGSDEILYDFLKNGAENLREFGEIFYSDTFKNYKIRKNSSLKAIIKDKDRKYLDLTFNIDGIDSDEIKNIIIAVKNNKKFFKLKDNSFLDLENSVFSDLNYLFSIIDANSFEDNSVKVHKTKAFILQESLDNSSKIQYEGRELLTDISDKIKDISLSDYNVPGELTGKLREYQISGFKWLKMLKDMNFGGILADEMGLGKTIQVITFLLSEKGKKTIIVTPTSLIYNWENEFIKFGNSLKIAIVHGTKKERTELIQRYNEVDIILTTYGTLRNDIELYSDKHFDYCIIDEGQNIKNPTALNTETVKKVNSDVRFVLTGTPIENSLIELWSIFDFVLPGYLFDKRTFKEKFVSSGDIDLLKKLIKPFILRRLKKDVMKELPDKIEKKFYVELGKEQKEVYKLVSDEAKQSFDAMNPKESRIKVLAALTRLRQICLDPAIVLENYKGRSGKVDVVLDLIEGYVRSHEKILLFSQFTSLLKVLSSHLDALGIGYYYLDGSTKASDRIELVNKFNQNDDKRIFLISLKAGGSGLNLTSANIVIHFDPWWNPAIEDQASDRAHRMGQKNVVQVIKLVAKGTIEEKVLELQEEKKELINKVVDGDYTKGDFISKMSVEDLIKLFDA